MKREITIVKSDGFEPAVYNINDTVDMWLRCCPKGEWTLKLEKTKKQRSVSQNALMWLWMDAIAKEWTELTGEQYTREQVKDMFAKKFLPVDSPMGVVGRSTSSLSVEEMCEFMNKVQAYAATEWGIPLLTPEDRMFKEWREQYE